MTAPAVMLGELNKPHRAGLYHANATNGIETPPLLLVFPRAEGPFETPRPERPRLCWGMVTIMHLSRTTLSAMRRSRCA